MRRTDRTGGRCRWLRLLRRAGADESGFTLMELLLTCGLFAVVLTAILGVLDVTSRAASKDQERSESLNEAAAGLRRMTTELRNAYRVLGPTGQQTSNYLDVLVREAGGAQRVLYTCDNPLLGTPYRECIRFVSAVDSTQAPGTIPFPANGDIVVRRITNGSSVDPVFTSLRTTGTGGQPVFGQATFKVPATGDQLPGNAASEVFSGGFYMPNLTVGQ